MNRLTLALSSLLLVSCAGVDPTRLKPVTTDASITLRSAVTYSEYYSLAGNRFHYTIDAGGYTAKYTDNVGVYYDGPGNCFTIKIESDNLTKDGKPQPAPHSYRCGIFVPTQTSSEAKLYFYRDPAVSAAILNNTTVQVVDSKGVPVITPAAGAGAGLGMGLVRALDAAELKNLHFFQDQPKSGQIKAALQ
jgi:hypothetical protein